jgi:hypothetical protein
MRIGNNSDTGIQAYIKHAKTKAGLAVGDDLLLSSDVGNVKLIVAQVTRHRSALKWLLLNTTHEAAHMKIATRECPGTPAGPAAA